MNSHNQQTVAQQSSPASKRSGPLVQVYRLRVWLHGIIYAIGFASSGLLPVGSARQRVWLALPELASVHIGVDLRSAIISLTALAAIFALLGAWLRTWGSAYLGGGVVFDSTMRGVSVVRDGPFRYLRNPLYLGTFFHTLALCVLMAWPGALFVVVSIVVLQMALIASEENFLGREFKDNYLEYKRDVPRILPRLSPCVRNHGTTARWPQAVGSEIYMWGTAVSFAAFGWTYNPHLIIQGVLVSFGLSLAVRGLITKR